MAPALGERVARLWRYYHTPQGRKMFRYVATSAISTVVSFVVLAFVYGVLRLWTEVPSVLFSNVVASIPSYFLSRNWVWGKTGRSHLMKEVIPFWVVSILGIIISIFAAAAARHFSLAHFPDDHALRTLIVEGANLFAFAVLWVAKFLFFNRLFRHPHPQHELVEQGLGDPRPLGNGSAKTSAHDLSEAPDMLEPRGRWASQAEGGG